MSPYSNIELCITVSAMYVQPVEKSVLRRLQVQTLPDEAPPIGKIHPFSKMAITFKPVMQFVCPLRCIISYKIVI